MRKAAIVTSIVCMSILLPSPGRATYPGGNGLIAFTNFHTEDIFVMNGDGGLPAPFVSDPKFYEDDPSWSADGGRLVFATSRFADTNADYDLEIINADGTGQHALTDTAGDERHPVFSPDGTQIAFIRRNGGASNLFVMNDDGTGEVQLTQDGDVDGPIDWRPDGSAIVFSIENDFGVNLAEYSFASELITPLTPVADQEDGSPSYSPDGTKIAYVRVLLLGGDTTVRVMNDDGTGDHASTAADPTVGEVTWAPDGASLLIQEDPDDPKTVLIDPDEAGRQVLSHEYAQSLAWQPCADPACEVSPPRPSLTEVTLAVRNSRDLNVFADISPIREGDTVLVTLFRNEDGRKFIEFGTIATTIGKDGLATATFHVGRRGQCKAKAKYLGSDDYKASKDTGKFSCKGGLAH